MFKSTIIIPTHNYGKFIEEAVESALNQTVKCNIVVVDDASTDNTKELLHKYDTIEVLTNETSLGPSPTRNRAIEYTWEYTDYWFNLDADDAFLPTKVERFLEKLEDPNIGIVYADYNIINNQGISRREFKEPYNRQRLVEECIIHSGAAFSKQALERVGIQKGQPVYDPSLRFCEDWDLWLKLTLGSLGYHIAEVLTNVKVHGENLSFLTPSNQEEWNRSWGVIRSRLQNGNY